MGADIYALTSTSETAADLAERCGGKLELVQLLRAAEGNLRCIMTKSSVTFTLIFYFVLLYFFYFIFLLVLFCFFQIMFP